MFGGKKKDKAKSKSKETSTSANVKKTGGEIDVCVMHLLGHASDKNEAARAAVISALHDIGGKQTQLVLTSCVAFAVKKASKIDTAHRVTILKLITQILEESSESVTQEVASQLIDFAANEMVASQEVKPESQGPASTVLVQLSHSYCADVLDKLLDIFKPGTIPHYFVLKTLADVAQANGVEFTLRIKDVLARTIPCLGSVKKSAIKWVFATALGRFALAMTTFDQEADDDVKAEIDTSMFSSEMVSAFDVLFTKWLLSKEPKVRFAVAESLGYLCAALDQPSLEERIPKLVPTYLQLFKKEKSRDHLAISQGMAAMLGTAVREGGASIEPVLSAVLQGLHPLICKPVDPGNPQSVKNHNEQLKCFEVLGRELLETTLNFVINRFQLKESPVRVGSLLILRHFVNSLDDILDDKKPIIMSSVITLVGEADLPLKKAILQLIAGMANHDYLQLEGGQTLVKFVVQQAAKRAPPSKEKKKSKKKSNKKSSKKDSKKPSKPAVLGVDQLRTAADHVLTVMTTKVPSTHPVLWPYLLELFADPKLKGAFVVLTKCIHHLASEMREVEDDEYLIDFKANVNIPSKQTILSRLMIMASVPFGEEDQGRAAIECMGSLGPVLSEEVGAYWDQAVPALLEHLDSTGSGPDWDLPKWQESLLKMFKQTINVIPDGKYVRDICQDMTKSFDLYKGDHELMRVMLRFLGAVVAKLDSKALVGSTIDSIIANVDHSVDIERQGIAQGLGLAGYTKLDVVLPKLTAMLDAPKKKESKGFFASLTSSKPKGPGEAVQATVLLSYGYVTAYADSELILSRLDVHVVHNLLPILARAPSGSVLLRVNVIKAIDLIGKALQESRLPVDQLDWELKPRDSLLKGILAILDGNAKAQPTYELRLLGLNAISTLLNLNPAVDEEVRDQLLNTVLKLSVTFPPEEEPKEDEERQPSQLLANLTAVLGSVVHMDASVPTLTAMLQRLNKWVISPKAEERERACTVYLALVKKFVAKLVQDKEPQEESALPDIGSLLAGMVPRCSDSSKVVRKFAAENVQILLYIDQLLENPENPKPVQEIKLITEVRNRLDCQLVDRLPVMFDLAAMVCVVLSIDEVMDLVMCLLSVMNDTDLESARGTAEFLKGVTTQKGTDFTPRVNEMMSAIVSTVAEAIERPTICEEVLGSMRLLCKHHFKKVVDSLLESTVPLRPEVTRCFEALVGSEDQKLSLDTIKFFFTILNDTPMDTSSPTPVVMTATCALGAVLPLPAVRALIKGSYPALFCSLLMRVGTACGVDEGQSSRDVCNTLRIFLEANSEDRMLEMMEAKDVWNTLQQPDYDDGITTATAIFCEVHVEEKRNVLRFLAKFYSQQSYEGQRVVCTALLAEFVNHSAEDPALLKELIKFLLPRVADKTVKVRKQALRGLGNLVTAWNDEVSETASSVVSALTSASEDTDPQVAAQAVASLTRIVKVVDEETIGPLLISICFRMRPAFDRKSASVRASAFNLFGALCRFGESHKDSDGNVAGIVANFIDQVHTNLPIFIVHLNDDNDDVKEACHEALKKLADLIDTELFEAVEEATPGDVDYDEFITRIAPLLSSAFPERLRSYVGASVEYFASSWTAIRGNAAWFAATLVASTADENRKPINTNGLCTALVKLLSQSDPLVRSRAAKSISLLYDV